MILRRVIAHFRKQEWTAIFLDFLIVVVGVFIGIQVSNWNSARADHREYREAIARVNAEATENIEILDKLDLEHAESLREATLGLETLRSCVDSEANRAIVNTGLLRITGTSTIHLQTTALDEMTTAPLLLNQQDPTTRALLANVKFRIGVMKIEAGFAETMPFRDRPETNPILMLGEMSNRVWRYHDIEVSRDSMPLILAVPISEACENDQLLKSFYNWQRFQSSLPGYSKAVRAELSKMKRALKAIAGETSQ